MPWFEWRQDDLPCVFSRERAEQNRSFLEHAFEGVPLALSHPDRRNGHFHRLWHSNGAAAFLEINWLAEDLRLLQGKPGSAELLRDLVDIRLCQPTWHVAHAAALFERAQAGAVLELVDARNAEAPDLIVDIGGSRIPVEAKLLTQSDGETTFLTRAKRLVSLLRQQGSGLPENTLTLIVAKRPPSEQDLAAFASFCESHLATFAGTPMAHRGELCNLFVEPIQHAPGLARYSAIWVMTAVPESESLRVLQRAKKASRQLRAFPTARNSGIMAVGLADPHLSHDIFGHIARRIELGRFSGIAAVLLTKRRIWLGPPIRTTFDLLEVRSNARATHPIDKSIALRPFGNAVRMSDAEQSTGGVYAWRYGTAGGAIVDKTCAEIRLPDFRMLTPEMLA